MQSPLDRFGVFSYQPRPPRPQHTIHNTLLLKDTTHLHKLQPLNIISPWITSTKQKPPSAVTSPTPPPQARTVQLGKHSPRPSNHISNLSFPPFSSPFLQQLTSPSGQKDYGDKAIVSVSQPQKPCHPETRVPCSPFAFLLAPRAPVTLDLLYMPFH